MSGIAVAGIGLLTGRHLLVTVALSGADRYGFISGTMGAIAPARFPYGTLPAPRNIVGLYSSPGDFWDLRILLQSAITLPENTFTGIRLQSASGVRTYYRATANDVTTTAWGWNAIGSPVWTAADNGLVRNVEFF